MLGYGTGFDVRALINVDVSGKAAAFFANVPWLGIYVGKIPALVRPVQISISHGQKSAERRVIRGSTTRDLFHYLVCHLSVRLVTLLSRPFTRRTTRTFRTRLLLL